MRVARHCKRLLSEAADAPSLAMFKVRLDRVLSRRCSCSLQVMLDEMIFKGPFQPKPFYGSMILWMLLLPFKPYPWGVGSQQTLHGCEMKGSTRQRRPTSLQSL